MARKNLTILAAQVVLGIGLAIGLTSLPAQLPTPVISSDAAAERIPNLSTLKTEVKQYHDCTLQVRMLRARLDAQADRAIEYLHRIAAIDGRTKNWRSFWTSTTQRCRPIRRWWPRISGTTRPATMRGSLLRRRLRFPARCGSTRKRSDWG
ncbi:MAG: hypothetical protein WDM87_02735 [Terracidiphilus sp.]